MARRERSLVAAWAALNSQVDKAEAKRRRLDDGRRDMNGREGHLDKAQHLDQADNGKRRVEGPDAQDGTHLPGQDKPEQEPEHQSVSVKQVGGHQEKKTRESQVMELIASVEGKKAALENRLEIVKSRLLQNTAVAFGPEEEQDENNEKCMQVLRAAQLDEARLRRLGRETGESSRCWYWPMRKAVQVLDSFWVARPCLMEATELMPRLWDMLEDGGLEYDGLVDFYYHGHPSANWRCLATLVSNDFPVPVAQAEWLCPDHERCLQVRLVEEDGNRAIDFRLA